MRATQLEDCKKDYNTVILVKKFKYLDFFLEILFKILIFHFFRLQAAEEKNVSESLIREKLATLPEIKKEVHVWEKKYQVICYGITFPENIFNVFILLKHNWE